MKKVDFNFRNQRAKGESLYADTVKESKSAFHLVNEVHGNVIVVPFEWVTDGDVEDV